MSNKLLLTKEMGLDQLSNIDNLVDDGEINEIEAFDVLDLFPEAVAGKVLSNWIAKLAHKGQITLSCPDLIIVAKLVSLRGMSISKANEILYGDGSRKAAYSNEVLETTLKELGLNILKSRTSECRVVIVAERP